MAQYRQSGADRLAVRIHHDAADRIPHRPARIRRQGKPPRRPSLSALAAALVLVLLVALAASGRLSPPHQGFRRDLAEEDGGKDESEFHAAVNRSAHSEELNHGRSSGKIGRDSLHGEGQRTEKDDEKRSGKTVGRLYNEGGRAELDSYKEDYEASVQDVEDDDPYDEYDDDIDVDDKHDDIRDTEAVGRLRESDGGETRQEKGYEKIQGGTGSGVNSKKDQVHVGGEKKLSGPRKKLGSKRKSKRHKFSSSSCEIKFLNSTAQIVEPLKTKKFAKFSLQYAHVENRPNGSGNWEPRFAGHQTLEERERSFYAHDQTINCGFVKGPNDFPSTGFDIAENDTKFMSNCHIAVSSCIFGNSDRLRSPFTKMITRFSRKNVCFVMFMDDITLQTLLSDGQKMENGFIGFWKVVVVSNLPYPDMRRVGKIPKFLSHRLFPSARYSIWLDSKLRLQSDPSLILEYFLWRRGFEYAISNHYHRHCVWEEVMQNKKLNKYNHTVIDQQFEFYQSDGLKRFDPSDPNKLLPSYVPEGSFIVREHTPMSNLFSCLWFNEVDRFTPRDQLSFAYTYHKLRRMNPRKPFYLNMFKDCERRAMAKLFRHRAEEKSSTPTQSAR